MTAWNEMVKTALLGTDRAELPTTPATTPLNQLINQIPRQDDANALLAIAGAVALHTQTGWQPAQGAPLPATPHLPSQPACPNTIASQLDVLLEGTGATLLPEILAALAQTGHRASDALLPNLLDKGAKLAKLRPFILQVLGWQGRWLASQNPEWGYASLEMESWAGLLTEWQTAIPAKRQALLHQLRLTQPDRGRQILEHTWKSNNDLVRNQLIKILDINLSLVDEPFLETALDDRNHLVRRTAADLLARLPTSRLAQRMIHHVADVLTWTPNKKHAITVRLPVNFTPAMLRDGIPNIKPEERSKLRTRLLTQTISRVPLQHWTKQWQQTPLEIAQAARNSAWPRSLMAALGTAAVRQQDEAWAAALITANQFNTSTGRLVPVLSSTTCFSLMQQAAKQSTELQRPQPLSIFLQHWQNAWTVEMGQFWLDLFARHLKQTASAAPDPTLNNLFKRFGQKCPPELADTAVTQLTTIPDLSKSWQKTIHNLGDTLQLRHNLLAEINSLKLKPQAE